MGVTIHFEGHLRDHAAMKDLLQFARRFASERGWVTDDINEANVKLSRVDENERDCDYLGPLSGLKLIPGNDCEPIKLEFDNDLYVQEWTKTQFAGAEIHLTVCDFLHAIEPYFETLKVNDEAEYWDTGDIKLLKQHLANCDRFIEEHLQEHPTAKVKVKEPTGRIVDMITYD
jgi:hypothetical protein